jgi:hypothetical protein
LNHGIHFAPLLPWPVIAGLAAAAALLVVIVLVRKGRGAILRGLAFSILVIALANPGISRDERQPQPDLAVIVVDESASMAIASRREQAEAALASVEAELDRFSDLEIRVVRADAHAGRNGTTLFAHLQRAIADEPAARLAGVIMITDGQVHDAPDPASAAWLPGAPLHVLLTGERGERDRRMVIEQAPAYGLVGTAARITFRVEDGGAQGGVTERAVVQVRANGHDAGSVTAVIGESHVHDVMLDHAGPTVIELEAEAAPEELSLVNNRAVVTINGVRERLRVLLVSGQPHPGERTWRNLLKADPSVDLIHFTILRPPDKDDFAPIHELSLIAFPVQELFEEQLDRFDLIVFDRFVVGSVIPWHYLERTARFLEDGGAILLDVGPEFAGMSSLYRTPLGRVMPAAPTGRVVEQAFRAQVSDIGRRHPVTSSLPGETVAGDGDEGDEGDGGPQWGQWFRLIETEALRGDVLMHGPDGRPLLIVDRFGEGRIAGLMSDHIWLWARGYDGGGPHAELMRRLVHWLMKEPELEEERLVGRVEGERLVIERHSLATQPPEVSVMTPDGSTQTVTLSPGYDGIAHGEVAAPLIGLYRIEDGNHLALAASGPANPPEFTDLRATPEHLEDVIEASGGGIAWLADGLPEFRRTAPGRETAGRQWMGLRRNGHAIVTGIDEMALFSPYMILGLALAGFAAAWWREGR